MGMEHRITAVAPTAAANLRQEEWMRESRFGRWFLGTEVWRRYVLADALDKLAAKAGHRAPDDAHILDIGCGQGTAAALLDEHFRPRRITGIDIDAELIALGRAQAAAQPPPTTELVLVTASATDIPLADGSIDLVLCHQLLHHMVAQREALAEMHRVLRPGGLLLMAESCRRFIESSLVRTLFRHPQEAQQDAVGFLDLVRAAGFKLAEDDIITESPWWSLPDLGLRR
ncbi:MAG: class I SAM-dependent methyltransferase, partial [Lamprobacter sp.]|uniref:class I SAM-dependent methyltransferase n=1 Tax=Lamprobacter sp. TaxID=3100796 RepID=UPI002B261248